MIIDQGKGLWQKLGRGNCNTTKNISFGDNFLIIRRRAKGERCNKRREGTDSRVEGGKQRGNESSLGATRGGGGGDDLG